MYGDVPPLPDAVALPSLAPLQLALVELVMLADTAVGSVIVTVSVSVQLLSSSTVTVYVPAASPVMVALLEPVLQAYVYGDVPPPPLAVAAPSLAPLQLALVELVMLAVTAVGSVIVI